MSFGTRSFDATLVYLITFVVEATCSQYKYRNFFPPPVGIVFAIRLLEDIQLIQFYEPIDR